MLIGLTGGIGSGKTTVTELFSALGVPVINADAIGKEIITTDQKILTKILEHFGNSILTANTLDKNKLRKAIFDNAADRHWLEQLLHPPIKAKILQIYKTIDAPYCLLETAILLESGFATLVDKIIVVDCSIEQQIALVIARNKFSKAEVKKIIKAQLPREERLKYADRVIVNDGDIEHLKPQVKLIHDWLTATAYQAKTTIPPK